MALSARSERLPGRNCASAEPRSNSSAKYEASDEEVHAAFDVNILNYASAIVTTNEIVDSLSTAGISVGH
jgi:hypothetical protein